MRVAVAGAGANIFGAHRRGLTAVGAVVVAVQDADLGRARRVGAELDCAVCADVSALLEVPSDVVVVLAPHPFHAPLAVAALRAGRHVLVEKPIADEVAEADRMVAEARRAGRLLAVAFQQRARPEVVEALRLVRAGFLGELRRASVLATWPRRAAYFRTAPWRGTWRGEGGGILINQGQHDLDLLCLLAGRPSRVVGWARATLHAVETEDTVDALAEWPGGATGSIRISTAEADEGQRIELTGTAGRLRLLPGRLEAVRSEVDFREYLASPGNPFGPPAVEHLPAFVVGADGVGRGGHEAVYRNLAAALAGPEPLLARGDEATAALELANAIVLSSRTGAEVPLPLDRAAYGELLRALRAGAASG
ncbi:MAG TPA: Gfo/Idh/MocA family oxidoreductase [Candidatus Dormibacteraeota bacterium]|nr:Gfo/Idh/MocA family oxidoreductase [Candidatus Dormibacteraeota bacterium]